MPLLFPCPGTIWVASCPASFQLISSTPALSGSGVAAWFPSPPPLRWPLCCPSLWTLHPPGQAARGNRCEPPQGMHGCGRHAWQPQTPLQTAGPQARRPCRPPPAARPGGPAASKRVSFSNPLVSSPSQKQQLRIRTGTYGEVLHAPGRQLLRSLHKGGTRSASISRLWGSTSDLVHSSSEASAHGGEGSPVEAASAPGSWPCSFLGFLTTNSQQCQLIKSFVDSSNYRRVRPALLVTRTS